MTAPALPAPLPRGYQARPGVCPFCKAAVADLPAHYSAPVKLGGCVDVAFALSDWTPYRASSHADDPAVFRAATVVHLRLGTVGRPRSDGKCAAPGCDERRATGRSRCPVHDREQKRAAARTRAAGKAAVAA